MYRYLKLFFDNIKGRNCEHCMLSFSTGEHNHCAALENRPICQEEGCRRDCPLIENDTDLPVIDANDERYKDVTTYINSIFVDYTRNDYRDLFKTKSKQELLRIQEDIDKKIECIRVLHEGLLQKKEACQDILEQLK